MTEKAPWLQIFLILLHHTHPSSPLAPQNKIFQGNHSMFVSTVSALLKTLWRWPNEKWRKHLRGKGVAEERERGCSVGDGGMPFPPAPLQVSSAHRGEAGLDHNNGCWLAYKDAMPHWWLPSLWAQGIVQTSKLLHNTKEKTFLQLTQPTNPRDFSFPPLLLKSPVQARIP